MDKSKKRKRSPGKRKSIFHFLPPSLLYSLPIALFILSVIGLLIQIYPTGVLQAENDPPDPYISVVAYGKASSGAIDSGSQAFTQSTCQMAAHSSANSTFIPLLSGSGTVRIAGNAAHHSVISEFSGSVQGVTTNDCNFFDTGECLCEFRKKIEDSRQLPAAWVNAIPAVQENRFLNENTAVVSVTAIASAERYKSEYQRMAMCISAARTNAPAELYFHLHPEASLEDQEISLPATRSDCTDTATDAAWSTCTCRVMLYAPDLRKIYEEI